MKTWALGWVGIACLAVLAGCANTEVEISNLDKSVQDLKQQIADMKQAHGELAGTVDRLKDSQRETEAGYGDLKQAGENLKNSLERKDNEYGNLVAALEQLKSSQARLANLTTRLATDITRRSAESPGGRIATAETPKIFDSEPLSASSETKGRVRAKVSEEGCEAVDRYLKLIDKATRSSYGTAQETQMDNALAELKQVMGKSAGQGDSARILSLAEEAKWYACNASKSRTYISGGLGWGNLLKENTKNLTEICSRQQ